MLRSESAFEIGEWKGHGTSCSTILQCEDGPRDGNQLLIIAAAAQCASLPLHFSFSFLNRPAPASSAGEKKQCKERKKEEEEEEKKEKKNKKQEKEREKGHDWKERRK